MNSQKEQPVVSIITTILNGEHFINRYLSSILQQTYSSIELLIVNDGSIDKTETRLFSFFPRLEKKGVRIWYHSQENQGLGAATNLALQHATGDYLMWCNVDDYYHPRAVELVIKAFRSNPESSCVRFNGYVVDEALNIIRTMNATPIPRSSDYFRDAILEHNFHFGCSAINLQFFEQFNGGDRTIYPSKLGQNWQLLLPVLRHNEPKFIDEQLFYFVDQKNSISRSFKADLKSSLYRIEEYRRILLATLSKMNEQGFYVDLVQCKICVQKINLFYQKRRYCECAKEYGFFLQFSEMCRNNFYISRKIQHLSSFLLHTILRKWHKSHIGF